MKRAIIALSIIIYSCSSQPKYICTLPEMSCTTPEPKVIDYTDLDNKSSLGTISFLRNALLDVNQEKEGWKAAYKCLEKKIKKIQENCPK